MNAVAVTSPRVGTVTITARWLLWGSVFAALALLVVYPVYWLIVGSFQTEFR